MKKFRFSMLLAAALTIVTIALPASAASTPSPDNGSIGITTPQQPSTDNEQAEPAPPPCDGDFVPTPAPPPCDGDFVPTPAPPPCDGDFVAPAPPPDDGD
jgi:hypothetical protein